MTVGHHRLSGLYAKAERPVGLIVALHGGGYDARYWHTADGDKASLLRLGTMLGFDVLALDRPGYRGSVTFDPDGLSLAEQADVVFGALERIAPDQTPVFLVGHSKGGILAVIMAADARSHRLTAIDVSGVPLRYLADMQPLIDQAKAGQPLHPISDAARRALFYGDDGSFDAVVVSALGSHPVPPREAIDAFMAPVTLPPLLGHVTIPVQWTIADQERSSQGGTAILDHVRSLARNCPRLVASLQTASGHNISLHHVARAYHLRVIAFFDECFRAISTSISRNQS